MVQTALKGTDVMGGGVYSPVVRVVLGVTVGFELW